MNTEPFHEVSDSTDNYNAKSGTNPNDYEDDDYDGEVIKLDDKKKRTKKDATRA